MQIKLPHYTITELVMVNEHAALYRAQAEAQQAEAQQAEAQQAEAQQAEAQQAEALLLTPSAEHPTLPDIAVYRYTHRMLYPLRDAAWHPPHTLLEHDDRPYLVMNDSKGDWLPAVTESRLFPLEDVLAIGLGLARALHDLHQHGLVHRALCPDTLLYHSATQSVQWFDLTAVSPPQQSVPRRDLSSFSRKELAYGSPEQTGYTPHPIDHRSDLYSLGIVLYELLVGVRPFPEQTLPTLLHSHLTVRPKPPYTLHARVPPWLSALVMKLLAKSPTERYQSAAGVLHDLEASRSPQASPELRLEENLGRGDVPAHFQVSHNTVNREEEIRHLLHAFQRICQGGREFVLLSGLPGLGKATLAREVLIPLVRKHGRWLHVPFDPLQRSPQSGWLQAAHTLLAQLQADPQRDTAPWRESLPSKLGQAASYLAHYLPSLETLLGPQPELPWLPPLETQRCLQRALLQLFQAVASAEAPLVVLVEELHEANANTLQWLQHLLLDKDSRHILVLATSSSEDPTASENLAAMLRRLQHHQVGMAHLSLPPLTDERMRNKLLGSHLALTADTEAHTRKLLDTAQGNPLLLERLLETARQREELRWDSQLLAWIWCDSPAALVFSSTLDEQWQQELRQLPDNTRALVQQAACIGMEFDLRTLSHTSKSTLAHVAELLTPAIERGHLVSIGDSHRLIHLNPAEIAQLPSTLPLSYRFTHLSLQQEAYRSLSPEEARCIHERIGCYLSHQASEPTPSPCWTTLTRHMNKGANSSLSLRERQKLGQANLDASRDALRLGAMECARDFAHQGLLHLGDEAWQHSPSLAASLLRCQQKAHQLLHDHTAAATLASDLLEHKDHLPPAQQQAIVVFCGQQRIEQWCQQRRTDEARAETRRLLSHLGWIPATSPDAWESLSATQRQRLAACATPDHTLPFPSEANASSAEQRLQKTLATLALALPPSSVEHHVLAQTMLLRGLEHGITPHTSVGLMLWAERLRHNEQWEEADALGQQSLDLNQTQPRAGVLLRPMLLMRYGTAISPWCNPNKATLSTLEQALHDSLALGQFAIASQALLAHSMLLFLQSRPLQEVASTLQRAHNLAHHQLDHRELAGMLRGLQILVEQLTQRTLDRKAKQERAREWQGLLHQLADHPPYQQTLHTLCQLTLLVLDSPLLDTPLSQAIRPPKPSPGTFLLWPEALFAQELRMLRDLEAREESLPLSPSQESLQHTLALLTRFALHNPSRGVPLERLWSAEVTALHGDFYQAAARYDEAIQEAQQSRILSLAALALERAAQFYQRHHRRRIARGYLADANQAYAVWGAQAKVHLLERQDPLLSSLSLTMDLTPVTPLPQTVSSPHLDALQELLQTQGKINQHLRPGQLYPALVQAILHHTRAEQGALLLYQPQGLQVKAFQGVDDDAPRLTLDTPPEQLALSLQVIQLAERSRGKLLVNDAYEDLRFARDPHIDKTQPQAIACVPIFHMEKMLGFFYLEHHTPGRSFAPEHLHALESLAPHAAVALHNAQEYQALERSLARQQQTLQELQRQIEQHAQQLLRQQEEHDRVAEQLFVSEKMAQLGTLMVGLAHEFKNPTNYVHQGAQNLANRLQQLRDTLIEMAGEDADGEVLGFLNDRFSGLSRNLDAIVDGTVRLRDLLQDLRTFYRKDEDKRAVLNVVHGLQSTITLVKASYKTTVEFVTDFQDQTPVECHPGQINQVFMNLLINAAQAIEARQEADEQPPPGRIQIRTFEHNNRWLAVSIQDNGGGIPDELRERIFEPFVTTRGSGEGTGLGLAISRRIIHEHDGTLELESTPGEGTTITLFLPLPTEPALAAL